ncbi:MAG: ATP-binding cassette domain-containing protein [Nitrospinaceae bacterium]|nr:ABC transporter ATP-binding protein [Nitrospinaceae bacterium]NIR53707.1 ABC transporter ATP-binding protein [Nitrospinaceae bacterium]NIS84115.1 ABC transporter ATP-binding protein [Nitrospinaceae bacterium]NIT80916.1 ABC transporter ATP-binding protein [Nitrospinaceae bacterium]NIU43214.1 ABC transporter ATP-binding protein [Nitrospinaceae bacterium]
MIEGLDIFKTYNSKTKAVEVLTGASLQIQQGEVLGIVGASGSGKSTLLHILGGLDRPESGNVLFRGQDIFNQKEGFLEAFRNRHIGFVFQFFNLLPDFTALENAMFPGLIGNREKAAVQKKAEELLGHLGLKDRLHHKPGELSGGETQRVALARSLVNGPEILLADEPTGNLDTAASEHFMDLVRKLNSELKQTFVIVTHSAKIAKSLDRVLQLAGGQLSPIGKDLIL